MRHIHFRRLLLENLYFKKSRKFYKKHLFIQLLTQLSTGYFNDTTANKLTHRRVGRDHKISRQVSAIDNHAKEATAADHCS